MTDTNSELEATLEIPKRVYLDTQFCFAYLVATDRDHQAAADFSIVLKQLSAANQLTCYFSILTLDELAWKLGAFIYDRDNGQGAWRGASKTAAFRYVKGEAADLIRDFIAEDWITVLRVRDSAYSTACAWLHKYDLRPADLCHMVLASNVNAGVVSNDRDFAAIPEPPVDIVRY
jgi:predicted nucleic acid-binding protein